MKLNDKNETYEGSTYSVFVVNFMWDLSKPVNGDLAMWFIFRCFTVLKT
jgi:hypothetical protein